MERIINKRALPQTVLVDTHYKVNIFTYVPKVCRKEMEKTRVKKEKSF